MTREQDKENPAQKIVVSGQTSTIAHHSHWKHLFSQQFFMMKQPFSILGVREWSCCMLSNVSSLQPPTYNHELYSHKKVICSVKKNLGIGNACERNFYQAKLLGTKCTNILKTGKAIELVPWLGALPSPMGDFSTPMEPLI